MGYSESFSIPNKDVDTIRAYLADCQRRGMGKSEAILGALKTRIDTERLQLQQQKQQQEGQQQ